MNETGWSPFTFQCGQPIFCTASTFAASTSMDDPRYRRSSRYSRGRSDDEDSPGPVFRRPPPLPSSGRQNTGGTERSEYPPSYSIPYRSVPRRQLDLPERSRYPDPQDLPPPTRDGQRPRAPEPPKRVSNDGMLACADPAQRDGAKRPARPPKQRVPKPVNRQYQYEELEESCIRLIKILGERKTMIQCQMMHVSLDDLPRYMAISYAWGDTGDTKNIELDDAITTISASLHGALQALRQNSRAVLVWADALCINQGNRDERTEQVALMTRIYAEADEVALWLGPEEDDSASAIGFLQYLDKKGYREQHPSEVERLVASEATKPQGGRFGAVVDLFERDYWYVYQTFPCEAVNTDLRHGIEQAPLVGHPRSHERPVLDRLLRRYQDALVDIAEGSRLLLEERTTPRPLLPSETWAPVPLHLPKGFHALQHRLGQ